MYSNHQSWLTCFFFNRAYKRRLLDSNISLRNLNVLDVGAGFGHMTSLLIEHGSIVDAVEPRSNCIESPKYAHVQKVYIGFLEKVQLPDDYYDLAVSITVLDEVQDKSTFIDCIHKILKADGLLMLEVRNPRYMPRFRNNRSTDLHLDSYIELLESGGFVIDSVRGYARPLTFGSFGILLRTLLANLLNPILPSHFRQMLVIHCRKV